MKLSIVIPLYNLEKYIKTMLQSLNGQSDKNFEIILINDGSTDNTYNVTLEILSEMDIDYKIITIENRGVSVARNIGLSKATGKYVLFIDGDDYVSSNLVETILKHVDKQDDTDIICWGFNLVNENKSTIINYYKKYSSTFTYMSGYEALMNIISYKKMRIWTGSAAYRREFLYDKNISYTEGCPNGEDQEFTYKCLGRANKVLFINDILSYYLQRKNSISNSYNIRRFEALYAFERAYNYIIKYSPIELNNILNTYKDEAIIENFFYNLNSILESSKEKNINNLLNEIEIRYSELYKQIYFIMRNYSGRSKKLKLRINTFLISPYIYYSAIKYREKLKLLGQGLYLNVNGIRGDK